MDLIIYLQQLIIWLGAGYDNPGSGGIGSIIATNLIQLGYIEGGGGDGGISSGVCGPNPGSPGSNAGSSGGAGVDLESSTGANGGSPPGTPNVIGPGANDGPGYLYLKFQ